MRAAQTHGLGLYNFPPSYTNSGPPSAALYPPSPQHADAWTHLSTGPSPLMNEAGPNPWQPNYEQPTPRSPIPWAPHNNSQRSSISSAIFSREGSAHPYSHLSQEAGSPWGSEEEPSPAMSHPVPMTLAPEYLHAPANFTHSTQYPSPMTPHFDPSVQGPRHPYHEMAFELPETPPTRAHSTGSLTRKRQKRTKTTPENARFTCEYCDHPFTRKYNYAQHLKNKHQPRIKEHICNWEGCTESFGRKTDLLRHEKSLHVKEKKWKCNMCGRPFARKDTLIRHEESGCPNKNHVPLAEACRMAVHARGPAPMWSPYSS